MLFSGIFDIEDIATMFYTISLSIMNGKDAHNQFSLLYLQLWIPTDKLHRFPTP